MTYSPTGLDTGADFKWDRVQSSYLYLKVPVNFTDSLSWKNNFLSMNNSVAFRPSYQVHPYLLEDQTFGGYDAANIKSIAKIKAISSFLLMALVYQKFSLWSSFV